MLRAIGDGPAKAWDVFMRLQRIHPAMTGDDFFRLEFALQILATHGLVECPVIDGIRHWAARSHKQPR
ncbi:hypothetical protein GALL_488040 [mine drainage metagenome]|uniref:Uncharacterized protein n=1 Tax=mine drainage metagenome TaxID=410659 RepID=A0A1J5PD84_9ZZZZ